MPLYNVGSAVGKAGTAPNRRDEVMTVQYFLKLLCQHPASPFRLDNEMLVDGFIGPVTLKLIHHHQAFNARNGYPVRVDDRIVRSETRWNLRSRTRSTP